jgi:hypothetical protein
MDLVSSVKEDVILVSWKWDGVLDLDGLTSFQNIRGISTWNLFWLTAITGILVTPNSGTGTFEVVGGYIWFVTILPVIHPKNGVVCTDSDSNHIHDTLSVIGSSTGWD